MAWDLILHIVSLLMSLAIVAMIVQQILCITDLEADYINPFDATSSTNRWIIPEFLLQALLCILCLFSGHWILFLLALPITYYHATLGGIAGASAISSKAILGDHIIRVVRHPHALQEEGLRVCLVLLQLLD